MVAMADFSCYELLDRTNSKAWTSHSCLFQPGWLEDGGRGCKVNMSRFNGIFFHQTVESVIRSSVIGTNQLSEHQKSNSSTCKYLNVSFIRTPLGPTCLDNWLPTVFLFYLREVARFPGSSHKCYEINIIHVAF